MTFEIKGLDKINEKLDRLSQNAQPISGTNSYSFNEIFSEKFMRQNTNFTSIEDFLTSSPENISTPEEFEKADEAILDTFVSEQTKFSSWKEMLIEAQKALLIDRLGF